ncbi:MAG: YceI family protein [Acidobacteria bacterium]|nr:YceI family protein [Acidobacteriota bacterium]MCB9377777.1 YceI family protein [Holophagales bacterium]
MNTQTWQIDSAHSGIHFSVRHLVIAKVRGQFGRWTGALAVPDGDFSKATVEVAIDAASIETGVADRDAHLRSADFFDVERFPEITFRSRRVEPIAEGRFALVGDLTLRGTTREVSLEVESAGQTRDPWGNVRAGFAGKTAVDRKEFGLTWNQALEAGGVMVGDKVEIEVEVEAVRQDATVAA